MLRFNKNIFFKNKVVLKKYFGHYNFFFIKIMKIVLYLYFCKILEENNTVKICTICQIVDE